MKKFFSMLYSILLGILFTVGFPVVLVFMIFASMFTEVTIIEAFCMYIMALGLLYSGKFIEEEKKYLAEQEDDIIYY